MLSAGLCSLLNLRPPQPPSTLAVGGSSTLVWHHSLPLGGLGFGFHSWAQALLTHCFCSCVGNPPPWGSVAASQRALFGLPHPGWVSVFLPSSSEGRECLALFPSLGRAKGFPCGQARPGRSPPGGPFQLSGGSSSSFLTNFHSVPGTVMWQRKMQFWCHHSVDVSNCSPEVEPGSPVSCFSEMSRNSSTEAFHACQSASLCNRPVQISSQAGDRVFLFYFFKGLFNLRGSDVEHNPVFFSYAIIGLETIM